MKVVAVVRDSSTNARCVALLEFGKPAAKRSEKYEHEKPYDIDAGTLGTRALLPVTNRLGGSLQCQDSVTIGGIFDAPSSRLRDYHH